MARIKTEITEIVTGLAMLGYQDLDRALEVRPRHITHVTDEVFERLEEAHAQGNNVADFETAWDNGLVFARSERGLRGRPPWVLEWKGPHKPASRGIETIPADLRIDRVYLISCKYGSSILHNSGPSVLFDHCLSPVGVVPRSNWYEEVAAEAFGSVWGPVHASVGVASGTPPSRVTTAEKAVIKDFLKTNPIDTTSSIYMEFVSVVSLETAARWRGNLTKVGQRTEMFWRLLRMQAAPYFVLGASRKGDPMRYQVSAPWDFAQRYRVSSFEICPRDGGQPGVDWVAHIAGRDGDVFDVVGHVEVRWAHGKLVGAPEAKVYLGTDAHDVPGYESLEEV